MKSRLAIFIDALTISFILSFILLFWNLKYIKNAIFCYFCSILALLFAFFLIFNFFMKKYRLDKINFHEQKLAKIFFEKVKFMSQKEHQSLIEKIFNVEHIDSNLYKNKNSLFYISFQLPLSEQDFVVAHEFFLNNSALNLSRLCFICKTYTESFFNMLSECPMSYSVFTEQDVVLLIKDSDFFNKLESDKTKSKNLQKLKSKVKLNVNKGKFKEFFFSGISLIVISIVIPFSIYYLIFGTILLLISVICFLSKPSLPSNNTPEKLENLIKDVTKK